EKFVGLPRVALLLPDGHHAPPGARHLGLTEYKGSRAGRKVAPDMEVLVFEAHRGSAGALQIDQAVADVVDLRILPPTTQLIVHLRPHAHPDDQPLDPAGRSIHLL